jgi:hypothetical protein
VLVLAEAAGTVLGAGEGVTKELTVFARFVAAVVAAGAMVVEEAEVEEMDLAMLPEVTSFACPSLAS